jgi:ubiquinone/menaquinone biosynthesis C-methylase UbiE
MAETFDVVCSFLRRARFFLKSLAYSGVGRDRWQQPDRVIAELDLRAGDRVADLGAGAGYFTFRLAEAVRPSGVVYAVDTDPDMPSALANRAFHKELDNVVAVEANPEDPGLPEAVKVVFLANTYHHIPDPAAYFARLGRYLRPGGRIAVIEALPIGLHRVFGHATDAHKVRSTLADAGYTCVENHGFLARQSFQLFERTAD